MKKKIAVLGAIAVLALVTLVGIFGSYSHRSAEHRQSQKTDVVPVTNTVTLEGHANVAFPERRKK